MILEQLKKLIRMVLRNVKMDIIFENFFYQIIICGVNSKGFRDGNYSQFLAALSFCSNFGVDFTFKFCDKLKTAWKKEKINNYQ